MAKRLLTHVVGITLIVAGVGGILLCMAGFTLLLGVKPRVQEVILAQVDLIDRALAAGAEGLSVAQSTLEQTAGAIASLEATLNGVEKTMGDTAAPVGAVVDLLGEQLPETIRSTQNTLTSASTSAKVVDDVLAGLTRMVPLPIGRCQPDPPLHQGLKGVADSLDDVVNSMDTMKEGLSTTSDNLQALGQEIHTMSEHVGQIGASLTAAQSVLGEYQGIVADLQASMAKVRTGLLAWLWGAVIGLSLGLLWVAVLQIGVILQGWELITRQRSKEIVVKEDSSAH